MRPFTRLTVASSLVQLAAGLVTLAYNLLVHLAFAGELAGRGAVFPWAGLYLAVAVATGALAGMALGRRLRAAWTSGAAVPPAAAFKSFLICRYAVSAVLWLGSAPLVAVVVLQLYGSLHPFGFPHFCASMAIGWLVSTTYSLALAIRWAAKHSTVGLLPELAGLLRALPFLAAGIPGVGALMFLRFVGPEPLPLPAFRALLGFLVALMLLGGYGFVYCVRLDDRLRLGHDAEPALR